MHLADLFSRSASLHRFEVALEDLNGRSATYGELAGRSDAISAHLRALGLGEGDRVGIYMSKSIRTVAAILGVLKAGAAYVPVDPEAPPARNASIFDDAQVRGVIVDARYKGGLVAARDVAEGTAQIDGLEDASFLERSSGAAAPKSPGLSFILYTSGSTGKPKGVMIRHDQASSFVNWCSSVLKPTPRDRVASYAPFHFDLSVFDLYASFKHGARTVLFDGLAMRDPKALASFVAQKALTIWYSTPSALRMLLDTGTFDAERCPSLRLILFAGEVYPTPQLRKLREAFPSLGLFNLYGPTETNVCTYYEVPTTLPNGDESIPIGAACSHMRTKLIDGELWAGGDAVAEGYWGRPDLTIERFKTDESGLRWYRTGDIAEPLPDGNLRFMGRRDRQIKKRGYRIELEEVERWIQAHPAVFEAAIIAPQDDHGAIRLRAVISRKNGCPLGGLELKEFCSKNLPAYMIPDEIVFVPSLPKTSTGKTDYTALKAGQYET